jgi:hypothetical protein
MRGLWNAIPTYVFFLICESIFFNHGSVLQQKDIKMLRENQRQILKIA